MCGFGIATLFQLGIAIVILLVLWKPLECAHLVGMGSIIFPTLT